MKYLLLLILLVSCPDPRRRSPHRFYLNIQGEPTNIHPINSTDAYASDIQGYILETLLATDPDTNEFKPALASKWKISKDKTTFDFWLREGVVFNDGTPLTAEDVVFSFECNFDDRFSAAHKRSYYEGIKSVEILSKNHIRFKTKNQYFLNFDIVAGMMKILPKHFYNNLDNKKMAKKIIIGTGPYMIKEYTRGQKFLLVKNPLWWGKDDKEYEDEYKISELYFRFVKEENISLELLKKGDIDFMGFRPEAFVKKTNTKLWKERVVKVKTENKTPKNYSFVGFNLKDPILKSKAVRKALSLLMNRPFMVEKFEYSLSDLATGPIYFQSDYANPDVKPVPYDPQLALKTLRDEGWRDSDNDGILDKVIEGKKRSLKLTILEPSPDFMKYLTIYKEDARKMGVEIEIKGIEWNSFVKLLDERKFQMVRLAWSGGTIEWDPKQIWHSQSSQNGGSNFVSYANPEVDRLIDEARDSFDKNKRIELLRKVHRLISEDYPYIFFFNNRYTLYGHTKRVNKPKDTFKYGIGTSYWSLKP